MRALQLGVVGLVLGFSSCSAIRDYAKEEALAIVKSEVAKLSLSLAETYVDADELAKWKAAADADGSGEVSRDEWWHWLQDNWEVFAALVGFGWVNSRMKRKVGQLWEAVDERTPTGPTSTPGTS